MAGNKAKGLAVLVGLALVVGGVCFGVLQRKQADEALELSSGGSHPVEFGGTDTAVDHEAQTITVALKWEEWCDNESSRTVTCNYSDVRDESELELIPKLHAGNEVRGYSWSSSYYKYDPIPIYSICLENGSRGQIWVAANERYPADPSFDEDGSQGL